MPGPSMPEYRADALAGPPPPGWYLDPQGMQVLRWWDGTRWGPQTQPLPGVIRDPRPTSPDVQQAVAGSYGPFPNQHAGTWHPEQHWQQDTGAHSPDLPSEPRSGPGHAARRAGRSKRHKVRNTILITSGSLVVLIVIAGIVGARGEGNPSATANTAVTNTAATNTATATARASASPHASSTTATMRVRMIAWYAGPGGTALNGVTSALGAIQSAGQSGNTSATGSACSQLASAVTTAQASPAMPYSPAEKWYTRGLAQYEQAAAYCQAGVSSMDTATIEQATVAIGAGNRDISHATAAINALSS